MTQWDEIVRVSRLLLLVRGAISPYHCAFRLFCAMSLLRVANS